jgi:hypothetical protein
MNIMVESAPAQVRRRLSPGTLIAVSLILSWLMHFLFWPLVVLPVVAGGVVLATRCERGWRSVVLASPLVILPAFSLARGVVGYLTGTGVLLVTGMTSFEFTNLDPKLRCHRTTSGCLVNGSEFLTHTPNNLVMEVLTRLFGPMPRSYRGSYPTRAEAVLTLNGSSLRFLPSELPTQAAALGLPAGGPLAQLQSQLSVLDPDMPIGAGIFQDEVIVLGREKFVILVERRTGTMFAGYLYFFNARMLIANGEFDKAIVELNHAVEVDPRNPEYLEQRGDAYAGKGDTARAATDYRKALEVAPATWYQRTDVEWKAAKMKPTGP